MNDMQRPFVCRDCNAPCDSPQFKDSLWMFVANSKDFLCVACFERLIGRDITWDDLEDCPFTRILKKIADRVRDGRL